MRYYSTNHNSEEASLEQAVVKGLAADRGLFMPERIEKLPDSFFENIASQSFHQIATTIAEAFFGEDINRQDLENIVCQTLSFDTPVVKVTNQIYSLELFHGPTSAFKDVGARFMARTLSHFISRTNNFQKVTVLVATSGDTGSAVANGFLGVDGIDVIVLYPKGKVSEIQEKQFTTLGGNITALEIDGNFDDCQRLVKSAFMDAELCSKHRLTSANSINVARFLPQAFYYFYGYAQLRKMGIEDDIVIAVPSGNFGNITAGLFAQRMGLPIKRFIAANNSNDIFLNYLSSGKYEPKASVATIANAMDVGDPSNFARIIDLYKGVHKDICKDISGSKYSDEQIQSTMRQVFTETGYILDPHGACGYAALRDKLQDGEIGLFLETAHPAKFIQTVEQTLNTTIEIPQNLKAFMNGTKQTIELSSNYDEFRQWLFDRQ